MDMSKLLIVWSYCENGDYSFDYTCTGPDCYGVESFPDLGYSSNATQSGSSNNNCKSVAFLTSKQTLIYDGKTWVEHQDYIASSR
jgi:hypothetical protein